MRIEMRKSFFYLIFTVMSCSVYAETSSGAFHNPVEVLKDIHQKGNVGKGIYDTFCAVCHEPDPVINVGAPRKGVKQDWQGRQRDLKKLLQRVDEGMNNMPPRGGCFECSDEDLRAAIKYLMK